MRAEIISTGDEIRTGTLVDTNTAFLAQELEDLGIEVVRHNTVGDDLDALCALFIEAGQRADVVLVSGGLGPTSDDVTAEAAAKAAGVELIQNPEALEQMQAYYDMRKFTLSGANLKQSYLPRNSDVLQNKNGTAPGFSVKIGRARFFFMPGVPPEMKGMFNNAVMPKLISMLGQDTMIRTVWVCSCFGLGESTVYERLQDFEAQFPELVLGFRASIPIVEVKIYANGNDAPTLESALREASNWVMAKLKGYVFAEGSKSLAEAVGELLRERRQTMAAAESCTGGLIASQLTDVPGSSEYFLFSAVTYANTAKENVLDVKRSTLMDYGAVSEETVREMAQGARKAVNADYGLAISGIAGPDGGTPEKPVGTVCIAVATAEGVVVRKLERNYGNRLRNKSMFAALALDMLRRVILGEDDLTVVI